MTSYYSGMFDGMVRFESVIWLPAAVTDAPPDSFKDFVDDVDSWTADLLKDVWLLNHFVGSDNTPRPDEVAERFAELRVPGFLVKAATPALKGLPQKGGHVFFEYSWGHYRTRWFYGKTIEEVADKAIAWSSEITEQVRAAAKEASA